jgi:preprotein translocase subunit SecD
MLDFPRWKVWLVLIVTTFCVAFSVPNFFSEAVVKTWPSFLPSAHFNLGLDLKGGSQLLLEADTRDVEKSRLDKMDEEIRATMRRGDPKIEIGDISRENGELSFMVRDPTQVDKAFERVRTLTNGVGLGGQRDWTVALRDTVRIVMTPTAAGLANEIDSALKTTVEVVHNRTDPDGTKEVTVVRQGDSRILVQVPGLQDPEKLKTLLGKTAKLEFKLVDLNANPADVAKGIAPAGSQILPYPDSDTKVIAVQRRVMVSGDQLVDAQQGFDQQSNSPIVNIRFNGQGGNKFARVTQDNVKKPFAIILDGIVLSAPRINEPILGGQAQISGNFTVATANDLAISLRSGKLPVSLKVVEERSVGPELGKESIAKGVKAGVVAVTLLVAFMLITYFRFGVYATIALVVNALMILGIMAMLNATLTLPGIAGFILTLGAAVDANVLIFERIREEIKRGRTSIASCEFGFKEASRAIFDANITNVISATIMAYYGTGPIRGFAVILFIGILTSVFTAVIFTRLLVANYLMRARPRELVI